MDNGGLKGVYTVINLKNFNFSIQAVQRVRPLCRFYNSEIYRSSIKILQHLSYIRNPLAKISTSSNIILTEPIKSSMEVIPSMENYTIASFRFLTSSATSISCPKNTVRYHKPTLDMIFTSIASWF